MLIRPVIYDPIRSVMRDPLGASIGFYVGQLFANGEQGAWYDPSDFSTLFQDAAGTIPVTAVEQAVGRILDKSGRGNHATQATAAARPVLGARKNLLLATTTLATQSVTLGAVAYTLSFTGTGTITLSGASTAGPLVGTGASNRVSLTFAPTAGSVTFTVTGSVTDAQLERGSALTRYQRVTTATDYDSAGFPHYLRFDGTDDFLVTGSINFTGIDEMTAFVGITKLSDASTGMVAELSVSTLTSDGSFHIAAPPGASIAGFEGASKGTIRITTQSATTHPAPATRVLSLLSSITPASVVIRVNGVQEGQSTASQGIGNYGNHPLYIGRRGGTSLPFNGQLNQLIIRGASSTNTQIEYGEDYIASKTGVTLP